MTLAERLISVEMNPKYFTMATIALFSASEQAHCALVVCVSESMTVASHRVQNVDQSGYITLWLLNGWCHVKLLLRRRKFCAHHTTMHCVCVLLLFTMSLYSKPHTCFFFLHPTPHAPPHRIHLNTTRPHSSTATLPPALCTLERVSREG